MTSPVGFAALSETAAYDPHSESPARTELRPIALPAPWSGLRAESLEIVSRGDFVPGFFVRPPERKGGRPALLLLAHDAGASAGSLDFAPIADWVARGLAVAAIDLPLHGRRASPKLSERLVAATIAVERGEALDPNGAVLFEEFMRQSISDLIRTLDAVLATDLVDRQRVGFLGLGLGARVGASMLRYDDRIAAAVLARTPGGPGKTPPPFRANGSARPDGPGSNTRSEILTVYFDPRVQDWPAATEPFLVSSLGL